VSGGKAGSGAGMPEAVELGGAAARGYRRPEYLLRCSSGSR
jgi:hypothetical protein